MSLNTTIRPTNVKLAHLAFIFGSFCLFSSSAIATATTYNGPTDLYSQEFNELTINGPSRLNGIKADTLTINGSLEFTEIKIKDKTVISGPCSGEDGEFSEVVIHGPFEGSRIKANSLQVDGDVALEDFKISENVNISGSLKAKNGSFKDINSVYSPLALYNVTVNNIIVKKNNGQNGEESNTEIKLAGNTIVSGDITFESGNGVVFIRDKTAQLKGKVIGGKIKE